MAIFPIYRMSFYLLYLSDYILIYLLYLSYYIAICHEKGTWEVVCCFGQASVASRVLWPIEALWLERYSILSVISFYGKRNMWNWQGSASKSRNITSHKGLVWGIFSLKCYYPHCLLSHSDPTEVLLLKQRKRRFRTSNSPNDWVSWISSWAG